MATTFVLTNNSTAAYTLGSNDSIYIDQDITIASSVFGTPPITISGPSTVINNRGNILSLSSATSNTTTIFASSSTTSAVIINDGYISASTPTFSAISLSSLNDRVYNTGLIVGEIDLGGGTDLYDGRGGRVTGDVSGGAGNDTLYGGLEADSLRGGSDNDTLYFDAEDLRFGVVLGGTGYDTGYNTDETTPLSINLTAQELEGYFGSGADELIVTGTLGGFGGFVRGGGGNDVIDGSAQGDNFDGGMGIDVLYGRGGLDDLAGGLGGDWIQGGTGADTFRYNALTDSTVNGQDFIADFSTAEGDKINLTNALAGLPAATFNTGFGTGTSVYVFAGGGGTSLVQVYTASTLQMQIVVSQASLAAGDFVF